MPGVAGVLWHLHPRWLRWLRCRHRLFARIRQQGLALPWRNAASACVPTQEHQRNWGPCWLNWNQEGSIAEGGQYAVCFMCFGSVGLNACNMVPKHEPKVKPSSRSKLVKNSTDGELEEIRTGQGFSPWL